MSVTEVVIAPRPLGGDEIVIADADELYTESMCACSAGDDNPY